MKSKRHRSPRPDPRKCIQVKNSGAILRLPLAEAAWAVAAGDAHYVTKAKWKAQRHADKQDQSRAEEAA